jgi:hypothetical protein
MKIERKFLLKIFLIFKRKMTEKQKQDLIERQIKAQKERDIQTEIETRCDCKFYIDKPGKKKFKKEYLIKKILFIPYKKIDFDSIYRDQAGSSINFYGVYKSGF